MMGTRYTYADVIAIAVGLVLVAIGVYLYVTEDAFSTSAMMGLICFVPPILKTVNILDMPNPLTVLIVASVGLHTYGLVGGLYDTASWFDSVTHTLSSMTVGILIFYAMMCIQYYSGSKVNFTGTGLSIITALLAMSFSVYWEVIEYSIDVFSAAKTQYSPYDTMTDLVCDSIGTFLASFWVGLYMRGRTIPEVVESFNLGGKLRKIASSEE